MDSNLAFDYLVAFLKGKPISVESALKLMLKDAGNIVDSRVIKFR